MKIYQIFLLPFSLLYGMAMMFRNWMFDAKLIRSYVFETPVISIGNLSMGGTGKTPHVEYLIRLLLGTYTLATLSRGYGRSSKGFILASKRSAYKYIGDEPLQYVRKFEHIKVAVDENRVHGIEELLQRVPDLDVVLLDDAFQHRYVKPGLSILLSDFHHLYTDDYVFPSGTLREFACGARRADVIIVTKTPKVFSPITRRRILEELHPLAKQKVFFSYVQYGEPVPIHSGNLQITPSNASVILLFTGIANDYPLREHLKRMCRELEVIRFPDHHPYSVDDLNRIKARFEAIPTRKKVLVTTEKDLMRLKIPELSNFLQRLPLFCIPIEIAFHDGSQPDFDQMILRYVEENTRNTRVPGKENFRQT